MRLIIPLVIILLGMVTGAVVCWLFKAADRTMRLSLAAGALGSFAGLVIKDAMDISFAGPALSALVAAVSGAAILSAALNIYFKTRADSG